MNRTKKIAIIIINWNQFELTKACINSIKRCNYKNYKIILVDNGSNDKSGTKLKEIFPEIIYIQNEKNEGFTRANNTAIKYALIQKFDYLMLLNNDTEVDVNFIDFMLETFKKDKKIGAVQPLILFWDNKDIVWNYGGKFEKISGRVVTLNRGLEISGIVKSEYTDWISGCCFMIKNEVIKKVGTLDDYFFVYYEDADWSIRIKKAGYKLGLNFNSKIYHHEGASWKSKEKSKEGVISPFTHYLNIRNHIYFIKKHNNQFNFIGKWIFQLFKITGYSIYFILKGRFNKLKMVFKGLIDGLNNNLFVE
jgi:GT2 family glycosyltransferase